MFYPDVDLNGIKPWCCDDHDGGVLVAVNSAHNTFVCIQLCRSQLTPGYRFVVENQNNSTSV